MHFHRQQTELAWSDAEAIVALVDASSREEIPASTFFERVTANILAACGARSVVLWASEQGDCRTLAHSGLDLQRECFQKPTKIDYTPQSWIHSNATHCITHVSIDDESNLGLELIFEKPLGLAFQTMLRQMNHAVIDIVAMVYLRSERDRLSLALAKKVAYEQLAKSLFRGVRLADSLHFIAHAIAVQTQFERVLMLIQENLGTRHHLAASSTQRSLDARSPIAGLAENLVGNLCRATSEAKSSALNSYQAESGSTAINVEFLTMETGESVAVIMERFEPEKRECEILFADIRSLVESSVSNAFLRDQSLWRWCSNLIRRQTFAKRMIVLLTAVIVAFSVLVFVKIEFWIPVSGRVVAEESRAVFAPENGSIVDLLVDNGSRVSKGDVIAVLRSHELETKEQQIRNEIATIETSLSSIGAVRNEHASSHTEVLKSQLAGLRQQLEYHSQRQAELIVKSPIDGTVDHWAMREQLQSRPISRGQRLANIFSHDSGWRMELEIDDTEAGYILDAQQEGETRCHFELRSHPGISFDGFLVELGDVLETNSKGNWVLKAMAEVSNPSTNVEETVRVGSTANVKVLAGHRSVGFVWFRGIVEWWRSI